ncbi:MAG: hypothetical protein IPH97_12735 [Ignavibacteriales bacterium]|nr:hypothetical protein [Ignavibacteriales bacterium]
MEKTYLQLLHQYLYVAFVTLYVTIANLYLPFATLFVVSENLYVAFATLMKLNT